MATTYEPIATTTLGSATNSVTFSSISGSYTDLVAVVSNVKHSLSGTGGVADSYLQFNSDTGNNYSDTYINGNGSTASSGRDTSQPCILAFFSRSGDEPGTLISHIQNYSNTTTNKTVLTRWANSGYAGANVGLWRNTAAITTVKFVLGGTYTFNSGAVFSLYGIKAA